MKKAAKKYDSKFTEKFEIRDVIHGLIARTSQEVKIINTPVFQRLRRIYQLAMANLVYPGAHHTKNKSNTKNLMTWLAKYYMVKTSKIKGGGICD